jgi:hypothetical protein
MHLNQPPSSNAERHPSPPSLKRGTGTGKGATLVTGVHASKTSKADKRRTLDEGA